jgi:hypothetical protein
MIYEKRSIRRLLHNVVEGTSSLLRG